MHTTGPTRRPALLAGDDHAYHVLHVDVHLPLPEEDQKGKAHSVRVCVRVGMCVFVFIYFIFIHSHTHTTRTARLVAQWHRQVRHQVPFVLLVVQTRLTAEDAPFLG
jgi:hypothetical protein